MNTVDRPDVLAEAEPFVQQCGPCDYGVMEVGCACPSGDYRHIMVRLMDEVRRLRAKIEDRRRRLVDAESDLLNVRGILSPNGYPRRVPADVEMVPAVAPAVQWLADEVDQLRATPPAVELSDRQLLAAVHRWARTHGWHATWIGWANAPWAGDATAVVEWDHEELTVRRRPDAEVGRQWPSGLGSVGRSERYPVTSVREAVDLLAALGVLPAELSSAYRAGVAAR